MVAEDGGCGGVKIQGLTGVECLVGDVDELGSSLPSKRFDMAPLCQAGAAGG